MEKKLLKILFANMRQIFHYFQIFQHILHFIIALPNMKRMFSKIFLNSPFANKSFFSNLALKTTSYVEDARLQEEKKVLQKSWTIS